MADVRERERERRARADGPAGAARTVAGRLRSGRLGPADVELLAFLGDPGARLLTSAGAPPPAPGPWLQALAGWGSDWPLRAGLAAAWLVLPAWGDGATRPPERIAAAARLDCRCAGCAVFSAWAWTRPGGLEPRLVAALEAVAARLDAPNDRARQGCVRAADALLTACGGADLRLAATWPDRQAALAVAWTARAAGERKARAARRALVEGLEAARAVARLDWGCSTADDWPTLRDAAAAALACDVQVGADAVALRAPARP